MSEQHNTGPQHRMLRRRVAAVTCAVTLSASVVGCSANPEPQPLDEQPAAANSTPSPTPSRSPSGPPTLPPQAKGTSKKSAIAFVEHVIDVLNYSAQTLDTRALRRLSAPECDACDAIVRTTEDIREADGRIEGGAWTPVESQSLLGGTSAFRQVQVLLEYAPQTVVSGRAQAPVKHPGGQTRYTFEIRSTEAGWELTGISGTVT